MARIKEIFTEAVDFEYSPSLEENYARRTAFINSVLIRIHGTPTTAEAIVIGHKDKNDSDYDTEYFSVDPSDGAVTNHFWNVPTPIPIDEDEAIIVTYPNTDRNRIAITLKITR